MTSDQLRYFAAIAENGSFSETGAKLNISQSSVTKQLQALEHELGVKLFDRSHRQVKLTEIGERLYPSVQHILVRLDALVQDTEGYIKAQQNQVKVVSLPIMGQYNITKALKLFEAKQPQAQIEILEYEEPDVLDSLSKSQCDIAIVRQEILPPGIFDTYHLTADELMLFVHEKHPLAGTDRVDLALLKDEKFMLMPKHTFIYQLSMRLCNDHGFTPNVLQCARIETILSGVESGRCCTLLMAKAIDVFRSNSIKMIPLVPQVKSNIVAVCSKAGKSTPMVRSLVNFLVESY